MVINMKEKSSRLIKRLYDDMQNVPDEIKNPRKQVTISLDLGTACDYQAIATAFNLSFSAFVEDLLDDQLPLIVASLEDAELNQCAQNTLAYEKEYLTAKGYEVERVGFRDSFHIEQAKRKGEL